MPTLSIHFTGGHYHATPWDRAQNEGAVEWPPSPWRSLRSLIATGYAKLPDWQGGIMPDTAKLLIEKLASVPPSYRLPPATGAHTRHYMPTKGKPTLVLDARAIPGINHEPLLIHWDVTLPPEEEKLLAVLAACLGYLGRAESWCEAELVPDTPISDDWCVSEQSGPVSAALGWEQIALIAPVSATAYAAWREEQLRKSGSARSHAAIPSDLVSALQCETGALQKQGWTQPPGSRVAMYWRPPNNAISTTRPNPAPRPACKPVHFVLLALASSARSRSSMPLAVRTLPQAELLHRAIASHVAHLSGAENASAASELLGLSPIGHRHAHILPLALIKQDHHFDHILLWAPGGFHDASQTILRRIRATYMKGGVGELSVRFVGAGESSDFDGFAYLRPILATARMWQSVTPFVLPRFRKKNGKNTIEGQVIAELASRGLPAPATIEVLKEESIAFRHFVRVRRNSSPPEDYGYALRLTFTEPVAGPLCLGYASHFGLGLFAACPGPEL